MTMPPLTFVTATDLAQWADRLDARGDLPQLVRLLVRATISRIRRISFRAQEGVQLPGWDGLVEVEQGHEYIPHGTSVWELTTREDTKAKADEDYAKRLADPRGVIPSESTFVFATLRGWSGKDKWAKDRTAEGRWRKVCAYDAYDLIEWLEVAPAVHLWLSERVGKHPQGAIDLDSYWTAWSASAELQTPPEFVVAGRDDVVERIHTWLGEPTGPLSLKAASREEALAVFAAAGCSS